MPSKQWSCAFTLRGTLNGESLSASGRAEGVDGVAEVSAAVDDRIEWRHSTWIWGTFAHFGLAFFPDGKVKNPCETHSHHVTRNWRGEDGAHIWSSQVVKGAEGERHCDIQCAGESFDIQGPILSRKIVSQMPSHWVATARTDREIDVHGIVTYQLEGGSSYTVHIHDLIAFEEPCVQLTRHYWKLEIADGEYHPDHWWHKEIAVVDACWNYGTNKDKISFTWSLFGSINDKSLEASGVGFGSGFRQHQWGKGGKGFADAGLPNLAWALAWEGHAGLHFFTRFPRGVVNPFILSLPEGFVVNRKWYGHDGAHWTSTHDVRFADGIISKNIVLVGAGFPENSVMLTSSSSPSSSSSAVSSSDNLIVRSFPQYVLAVPKGDDHIWYRSTFQFQLKSGKFYSGHWEMDVHCRKKIQMPPPYVVRMVEETWESDGKSWSFYEREEVEPSTYDLAPEREKRSRAMTGTIHIPPATPTDASFASSSAFVSSAPQTPQIQAMAAKKEKAGKAAAAAVAAVAAMVKTETAETAASASSVAHAEAETVRTAEKITTEKTVTEKASSDEEAKVKVVKEKAVAEEANAQKTVTEAALAEELVKVPMANEAAVAQKVVMRKTVTETASAQEVLMGKTVTEQATAEEVVKLQKATEKAVGQEVVVEKTVKEKASAQEVVVEKTVKEKASGEEVVKVQIATERAVAQEAVTVTEKASADEVVKLQIATETAVTQEASMEKSLNLVEESTTLNVAHETVTEEAAMVKAVEEKVVTEKLMSQDVVAQDVVTVKTVAETAQDEELVMKIAPAEAAAVKEKAGVEAILTDKLPAEKEEGTKEEKHAVQTENEGMNRVETLEVGKIVAAEIATETQANVEILQKIETATLEKVAEADVEIKGSMENKDGVAALELHTTAKENVATESVRKTQTASTTEFIVEEGSVTKSETASKTQETTAEAEKKINIVSEAIAETVSTIEVTVETETSTKGEKKVECAENSAMIETVSETSTTEKKETAEKVETETSFAVEVVSGSKGTAQTQTSTKTKEKEAIEVTTKTETTAAAEVTAENQVSTEIKTEAVTTEGTVKVTTTTQQTAVHTEVVTDKERADGVLERQEKRPAESKAQSGDPNQSSPSVASTQEAANVPELSAMPSVKSEPDEAINMTTSEQPAPSNLIVVESAQNSISTVDSSEKTTVVVLGEKSATAKAETTVVNAASTTSVEATQRTEDVQTTAAKGGKKVWKPKSGPAAEKPTKEVSTGDQSTTTVLTETITATSSAESTTLVETAECNVSTVWILESGIWKPISGSPAGNLSGTAEDALTATTTEATSAESTALVETTQMTETNITTAAIGGKKGWKQKSGPKSSSSAEIAPAPPSSTEQAASTDSTKQAEVSQTASKGSKKVWKAKSEAAKGNISGKVEIEQEKTPSGASSSDATQIIESIPASKNSKKVWRPKSPAITQASTAALTPTPTIVVGDITASESATTTTDTVQITESYSSAATKGTKKAWKQKSGATGNLAKKVVIVEEQVTQEAPAPTIVTVMPPPAEPIPGAGNAWGKGSRFMKTKIPPTAVQSDITKSYVNLPKPEKDIKNLQVQSESSEAPPVVTAAAQTKETAKTSKKTAWSEKLKQRQQQQQQQQQQQIAETAAATEAEGEAETIEEAQPAVEAGQPQKAKFRAKACFVVPPPDPEPPLRKPPKINLKLAPPIRSDETEQKTQITVTEAPLSPSSTCVRRARHASAELMTTMTTSTSSSTATTSEVMEVREATQQLVSTEAAAGKKQVLRLQMVDPGQMLQLASGQVEVDYTAAAAGAEVVTSAARICLSPRPETRPKNTMVSVSQS